MSSLFLNGLYTTGISALSETSNLLLGGTNTKNIQILSPIIGDSTNTLSFSSLNTTDIINTITQNFCFNSVVPSVSISVQNNSNIDYTSLTLDASNIIINGNLIINNSLIPPIYDYNQNKGINIEGSIGYIYDQSNAYIGLLPLDSTSKTISSIINIKPGVYYVYLYFYMEVNSNDSYNFYRTSITSDLTDYYTTKSVTSSYNISGYIYLTLSTIINITEITTIYATHLISGAGTIVSNGVTFKALKIA